MGVLLTGVLVLSACGGDEGGGDGGDGGATGDGGDGGGGETVSLLHRISGEEEQAALQAAIDAYEESSGNTVEAELSPDFDTVIVTRVQGGNPPDVALYPQPGLLEQMLDRGGVVSFEDAGVEIDDANLVPGMLDTGTFDDTVAGVVVKPSIKSLVWYNKPAFDEGGYTVPETWDDLLALTDEISSTGTPAWCIGIESGPDTGWVATDWIEDIMMRLHGGDVYDQWVAHELPFDSPEVTEAFETLEEIWFNEEAVLGGTTGILNTPFAEAAAPMFQDPPGCLLHRQAGFITSDFPGEIGTDYDVFALPPINDEHGLPILFSGDLAAVHTADNPAAAGLVEFLAGPEGQAAWIGHEGAGALSARSDFDTSQYPNPGLERQGELFANADLSRFDASDLMPGQVGAGSFWSESVAWINGGQDLQTTLQNIDASWPE